MAPTPGKKVKQDISTFLTTAGNLQGQTKNEPGLNTAYSDITKGVTGATNKAAGTAQQATKDTANKTSADALAPTTKVDTSAYTPPPAPKAPYTPPPSQPSGTPATVSSWLSGGPSFDPTATTTTGLQTIGGYETAATTGLDAAAAKQLEAGSKTLAGIGKGLTEGQSKITDDKGNVIGSNRGIGQVGQLNPLEQAAVDRQQLLGQQGPTSNTDALRALFGMNYNEALGPLGSQVYQGQVAQARGQAAADTTQRQQAEAGRIGANEQYTDTLAKGTKNVQEAQTQLGKNVDEWLKSGKADIAANVTKFKQDLDKNVKDMTTNERRTKIREGISLAMAQALQFAKNAGTGGTTPTEPVEMLKKLRDLGATPEELKDIEAEINRGKKIMSDKKSAPQPLAMPKPFDPNNPEHMRIAAEIAKRNKPKPTPQTGVVSKPPPGRKVN